MNGTALKRARLARGMKLRDVSAECERRGSPISHSWLSLVERGKGEIEAGKIPVLLEVLDLDIKELIPDAA